MPFGVFAFEEPFEEGKRPLPVAGASMGDDAAVEEAERVGLATSGGSCPKSR